MIPDTQNGFPGRIFLSTVILTKTHPQRPFEAVGFANFYLFQDIVTIIQAALVLFLANCYFWRSVPPKFNSELKMK
jgi:hypothetical protein